MAASSASAQSAPGGFTLPEPTPKPTPAPQGPVDVRSGVPIAPRSIPEQNVTPTPSPSPAQEEPLIEVPIGEENPANESTETPEAIPASPAPIANRQSQQPSSATPQVTPSGSFQSAEAETVTAQAADSAPASSIDALGGATLNPAPIPVPSSDASSVTAAPASFPGWMWALVTLALALVAGAIALTLRSRKARMAAPATVLARDTLSPKLSEGIEKTGASPAPPASETVKEPPVSRPDAVTATRALHIELDVVSATRSLMMLTVDCRVSVANRSDDAARNIALSGSLVCAQRSATGSGGSGTSAQTQTIERIGPQQSGVVTMQLQLPLSQIQPIRQGQKPLCIPLAQVTLEAESAPSKTHSFVIGSPSLANTHRLHPIPLDTPPGGIPGLLAREVKADGAAARAA